MPLSNKTLKLIGDNDYFAHFKPESLQGLLLWVVDSERRVIDLTSEYAAYFGAEREDIIGMRSEEFLDTASIKAMKLEHAAILRWQRPTSMTLWAKFPIGWRKVIATRSPLGKAYIIGVAQDITNQSPLNRWLLNIDLVEGRLPLGPRYSNTSLSWEELVVLHRMSRSKPYKNIAAELGTSVTNLRYRINRIKDKLQTETIDGMWEEVFTSGLIHLLSLPIEADRMFLDRAELLDLDPTITVAPRKSQ